MANAGLFGRIDQVLKADDVGGDISARILNRIAHPGLGRQVNDRVDLVVGEQGVDCRLIGYIGAHKGKPRLCLKLGEPGAFKIDRIIVVQIIDADHAGAARKQPLGGVKADKTGSACHQICHVTLC